MLGYTVVQMQNVPTTVVTGTLGAGKTTIIINLIRQLPADYSTVWLKNEYGDVNIDSELAAASNIQTKEILNGCLCCVLVGKLHDALEEIMRTLKPDRLIIETAGTAYPYPVIQQIQRTGGLELDGLIAVVDAVNYEAFRDNSMMAKQQARFVDLVILNKTGLVNEKQLEKALDFVHDQYPGVPKLKTADGKIHKDALIGLDARLVYHPEDHDDPHEHHDHHGDHADTVEAFGFIDKNRTYSQKNIDEMLKTIEHWGFVRIKGIINTEKGPRLLNVVFERITWEDIPHYSGPTRITFMGKQINRLQDKVQNLFAACAD